MPHLIPQARRRARSRQRGQAVVEFGIVAVIFAFLIMGIIDFGILLNAWLTMSSGSGALGRLAGVGTAAPTVAAQKLVLSGSTTTPSIKLQVLVQCQRGCWDVGPDDWRDVDMTNPSVPYTLLSPYTYQSGPYKGLLAPQQGAMVRVVVDAPSVEVVTPAVRAAFGCPGDQPHCYVPLETTATVRYEGIFVQ